jgi:hypothetical protein
MRLLLCLLLYTGVNNTCYTYVITQQIHIYKYVQPRIVVLQQHVPTTPVTFISLPYNKNTINIRYTDDGPRNSRNMLAEV